MREQVESRPLCRRRSSDNTRPRRVKHSTTRQVFYGWINSRSPENERCKMRSLPPFSPSYPRKILPFPDIIRAPTEFTRNNASRFQPQASDDVEFHCWHDLWEDNGEFLRRARVRRNEEFDRKILMIEEGILILVK